MGGQEERFIMFPATSVNAGLVNVLGVLTNMMIVRNFPPNFFKGGVHIDTKTGVRDMYKHERQNNEVSEKRENVSKINKPRLIVSYNFRNFDTKETGLGSAAFSQYPGSQVLRKDLRGYWRFFQDEDKGISLYTSDLRVKVDFEIIIDVATRDDQISMMTYLLNMIKFNSGHRYENIPTKFTLPNSLSYGLYKILYATIPAKDNIDIFAEYLKTHSNDSIVQEFADGKADSSYFRMMRIYDNIFVRMNGEPEMADPESKDLIYDKFSITFGGFLELYLPNSYIYKSPDTVGSTIISNILFISDKMDDVTNYNIKYVSTCSKSLLRRHSPHIRTNSRKLIEESFYADEAYVEQDFLDAFSEVWIKAIQKIPQKYIDSIFQVIFYEESTNLGPEHVECIRNTEDQKFVYRIKDCDPTKEYTVLICYDPEELEYVIKEHCPPSE